MKNLKEIEAYVYVCMIQGIDKVISGEEESVKLYYVRPNDVISYLKEIDPNLDDDEFQTNGWQWDYWSQIIFKGQHYRLSGDGYSQNYAILKKWSIS